MKILIATDTYKPTVNGVVTSIINLKSGLEDQGHEVKILTLSKDHSSHIDEEIYYIGSFDISKFYPDVRIKMKYGKKEINDILNWKPDIIHTQSEFSTFILAKKIAKALEIPIIHTYHTLYENYTHYFAPNKSVGKKIVSRFTNFIGTRVNLMIAPTIKIKNLLSTYEINCPVEVVPTGISLEKFKISTSESEINKIKEKLNIPLNHFVMLSVSRIGKEKNIDELINFMTKLEKKDVSLVLVGDGPYKKEIEELIITLKLENIVKLTGMIAPDEISKYYQMADLFVSASISETQGLTYIESLASGTPILCRKDDCLEEVLFEGENGYSFENEEDFFYKLEKFIKNNNKKKMSEFSKIIANKYSREIFIQKITKIYNNCIISAKIKNNLL